MSDPIYLPVSESVLELIELIRKSGTIEQVAQLQPLDAYRFPMMVPEYVQDQWSAAMDRLTRLAMEVTE